LTMGVRSDRKAAKKGNPALRSTRFEVQRGRRYGPSFWFPRGREGGGGERSHAKKKDTPQEKNYGVEVKTRKHTNLSLEKYS